MKKVFGILIVLGVGLTVLAGYFFQGQLNPILELIFEWGLLLVGAAGLIGIGYLLRMHLGKMVRREKGSLFSWVVLITFLLTLFAGFVFTPQSDFFRDLVLQIQIPVESSLLAVLAVTLLYSSLRLIRTRGWTPLSIGFLSSAVVSLVLHLGLIQTSPGSLADELMAFLRRLPLVGARGILLGMAVGGLIVGLRVILSIDRPYGEG